MAGREGALLLYEKWWRAACDGCHDYATRHKQEAIRRGWSLSRSTKPKGKLWQQAQMITRALEHGTK